MHSSILVSCKAKNNETSEELEAAIKSVKDLAAMPSKRVPYSLPGNSIEKDQKSLSSFLSPWKDLMVDSSSINCGPTVSLESSASIQSKPVCRFEIRMGLMSKSV